MSKRYKDSKKNKKLTLIFEITILIAILIFYGIKIIKWFIDNNENEHIQEKISSYIEKNVEQENEKDKDDKYMIDFKSLKEINEDTCGWIKVGSTNIEYTIVKTDNNVYYLNHNFEKKENVAGWIFADYRNTFNETDQNRIIYGHNMKNGSMFAQLSDILKKEWYKKEENKYITLVTAEKTEKYEVFSIYEEKASDYPIKTDFLNYREYVSFIETLKNKSIYNFNTDTSNIKRILTLSTCGKDISNRIILHAKLL